jgi:hypothetical protein
MTGSAKQSKARHNGLMGGFVASAQNCFAILSRAPLRKRFAFVAGNDDRETAQAATKTTAALWLPNP